MERRIPGERMTKIKRKENICYSVVRLWSFRLCGQVQHCDSTFRLLKTRPDVNSQQHAEILQSWVRIRNTQKGSYQTIHLLINKKHQKLYQNKNPSLKQKSPLKSFFGDRQEKKKSWKAKVPFGWEHAVNLTQPTLLKPGSNSDNAARCYHLLPFSHLYSYL